MNLPSKEQLHSVLNRIWAWWKRDFVVLGEVVGPRWWYLVIVLAVVVEEWWYEFAGGSNLDMEIYYHRMQLLK